MLITNTASLGIKKGYNNDAAYTGSCRRRKYHKKIGGKQQVKAHLENLGFVVGGAVTVISTIGGNVIVNVKESRIAISKEMAQKILI